MKKFLGVDIGGTSVKIGIIDDTGVLYQQDEFSVSFDHYATPIIETVTASIHQFLLKYSCELSGIAVSAAGQIDTRLGTVIGTCGNLPNYIGSNFKERFENEFKLKTTVVNDANCMVLGEKWIGAAQDHDHVIGVTLGTGVGGGILVNGKILLGSKGLAGEIGHFILDKTSSPCTCGNPGCFEQLGSTTSLIRKVKSVCTCPSNLDGKWIFEQARNNNFEVLQCIDSWIDDISYGLVSLVHIFNPSIILIGGGVSAQDELLIQPLRSKVIARVMPRFSDNLELRQAHLKNSAGMIGAVYYFLENE